MNPIIKFEATAGTGVPLARQLVCTIWHLDTLAEHPTTADPIFDGYPILVGSASSRPEESEISLPVPGNYLIDLGFPNGRRTRRTVSVTANELYRFVVHESQYTSSSVIPTASNLSDAMEVPRVSKSAASSVFNRAQLEVRLVCKKTAPSTSGLRALRAFLKTLETASSEAFLVNQEDSDLSYNVMLDSNLARIDSEFPSQTQSRVWLLVSGQSKDTTVVPFPNGWTSDVGADGFILTAHRKANIGNEATKWSVSLQLRDPSYGSLLDYLTRRDVHASAAVSRTIRSLALSALYKKQSNPYAAAAGAYMIAISDDDMNDEQASWMDNLTERFNWLPDGPIAQGYRLLRRTVKGTEDFYLARHLLFSASERGLPYFSIGLTLLTEALNFLVLVYPDDKEAKSHLAAAVSAQLACVSNEAFCTLQTSRFYRLPQAPDEKKTFN